MGSSSLLVRSENGTPRAFWHRGRRYLVVEVAERWRDTGRWWAGEAPKSFFRVTTAGGGLRETYLDLSDHTWRLYRIYD